MNKIKTYLNKSPLLFDGAMGTYYAALSKNPLDKCEFASKTNPELITDIHKEYVSAGCDAIKTNTFAIADIALEHGIEEAEDLIERSWNIAKDATSDKGIFVFANLGPVSFNDEDVSEQIYIELADKFISLGAECFLFETFASDEMIRSAAEHIKKKLPDSYIIASFAVSPDGFTVEGLAGQELVERILDDGIVDASGFNCVSGPNHLLNLVKKIDTSIYPLSVMPNAGYPTVVGGRTIYGSSKEYFASRIREMAQLGVKILGGCCGTDPDYIREVSDSLKEYVPAITSTKEKSLKQRAKPSENKFKDKLLRGEKVVAVELDSPMDSDISNYMSGAWQYKAQGADIITIADCPVARSRMDSSIVACKLQREIGIDTLPHMTCRDRNLNATKALLLGLSAEGVHNTLIVTGDPVPSAERDSVKSVYNFNSRMLIRYIRQLSDQVFQTPFFIGGALNVNAKNFQIQLKLAKEKIENGLEVFLTQPVMTERGAENLKKAREELDAYILGGIMPVVSYRNAQFISSEIQGMEIDQLSMEKFRDKSRDECTKLGIELSLKNAKLINDHIDGYYLITPFSRTDMICEIMNRIKEI